MFLSCLLVRVLPSRSLSSGQLSCSTGCKALHPLALTCQLITGHWLRQCVNEWKEVAGNELIRHLACEKPTPFADREERTEILKIQPQANPGKAPAACGSSPARPNSIGLFANVDEFGLQSHWACGVKSWRLFSRLQPQGFAPVFFHAVSLSPCQEQAGGGSVNHRRGVFLHVGGLAFCHPAVTTCSGPRVRSAARPATSLRSRPNIPPRQSRAPFLTLSPRMRQAMAPLKKNFTLVICRTCPLS